MATVNIDPHLVQDYDRQVNDLSDQIDKNLASLETVIEELKTNVTGTDIGLSIKTSGEKLESIKSSFKTSFDELSAFLQSQMSRYTSTFTVANSDLTSLLNQITTTDYTGNTSTYVVPAPTTY